MINTELLKAYFNQVSDLSKELDVPMENILSTLLKLPDVITQSTEVLGDDDWAAFRELLKRAIKQLNNHRIEEGKSIEADLLERINNIEELQGKVALLEPRRREKIREGLKKGVRG